MKILDGLELASYIKERQLKQVRALRQSWKIIPRLAIVQVGDDSVTDKYARLKSDYGKDIMVEVDVYNLSGDELLEKIKSLNRDKTTHGIVVQLPLAGSNLTVQAINSVAPAKDVDGLGDKPLFTPATATAIDWLLAGYNVNLVDKKIAIIGKGRLVGAPLAKLWKSCGLDVTICDSKTIDLTKALSSIDIIVSATGIPGLVKSKMIKPNAVVVDAGTASEHGKIVGDLADDVRERSDLTITPIKGGVGPLTVTALFDNVILASRKIADQQGQKDV